MPLTLKPGKELPLTHHHHWIFSGAVADITSDIKDGQITDVLSSNGQFLGQAYINRKSSLVGRVITFDHQPVEVVLRQKLSAAWKLRQALFDDHTNTYRLINSEGDGIPGLIIDRYDSVLVVQSSALGIDHLLPIITTLLSELATTWKPGNWSIYLKSTSISRHAEGLTDKTQWLAGTPQSTIEVLEDGLKYQVPIETSQKTGLFLDQREMRRLVTQMAKDKTVLNCFSYTGGFSLAALQGGASHVTSVDVSTEAIANLETNLQLNYLPANKHTSHVSDVFEFLEAAPQLEYQLVILDPPAFAKRQADVPAAMRAYRHLNSTAISKMPPHSWLVTSSCSYHIDPILFQKILFQAADRAGRTVRIMQRHRLAMDHPINIYHPEGEYLKSLVLYIE